MTARFMPGDRVRFAGGVGTVAYVEGIGVYVWPDAEQGSKPDRFSIDELGDGPFFGVDIAEFDAIDAKMRAAHAASEPEHIKLIADPNVRPGLLMAVPRKMTGGYAFVMNPLHWQQWAKLEPGQVAGPYVSKGRPSDDDPATTTWGRIRELVENESRLERRANELSDKCGALETERRDLLVENATLRRRNEVLERDAKRGRR